LERTIKNGLPQIPLVSGIIINSFYKRISEGILEYGFTHGGGSGGELLTEGYGLTESSGVPLKSILYGAVGPESLQVLLGERSREDVPFAGAGTGFCSAFAAWGPSTKTGEMIIGRNTDYPLNGFYDKAPTVIYFQPNDGQKFMAVTSAGIHNAGVVGFNESGIYLGVHTIPTRDVSPDGMPVFFLAQAVLKNAHNLDEAIEWFGKFHPPSGWSYLVASTKEKKVASIELSNKHMGVRPAVGTWHVQTNHYLTTAMVPHYLHVNVGVDDDSFGRFEQVRRRLASAKGTLDEKEAVSILSDKFDPFLNKRRGLGNVVAVHTTMTSVVIQPERNRLFVASGKAPVPMSTYVELPLVAQFNADDFAGKPFEKISNDWYWNQEPKMAAAEQEFIQAKIAFESQLDYPRAMDFMVRAIELDGTNPAYHFNHAMLALKANDFPRAKAALEKAQPLGDPHFKLMSTYYLGRIAAHGNDRKTARALFEQVLREGTDPKEKKLRAAAEAGLKKLPGLFAYKLHTGSMALMLQEADVVEYH